MLDYWNDKACMGRQRSVNNSLWIRRAYKYKSLLLYQPTYYMKVGQDLAV